MWLNASRSILKFARLIARCRASTEIVPALNSTNRLRSSQKIIRVNVGKYKCKIFEVNHKLAIYKDNIK